MSGARFLDLFAGSGAVGLEAASRGAAEVHFVEADRRIARVLDDNAERVAETSWRLTILELPGLDRLRSERFDLVFADPPYDFDLYEPVVREVASLLAPDGLLVIEHASGADLPREVAGLSIDDERSYGDTRLTRYAF